MATYSLSIKDVDGFAKGLTAATSSSGDTSAKGGQYPADLLGVLPAPGNVTVANQTNTEADVFFDFPSDVSNIADYLVFVNGSSTVQATGATSPIHITGLSAGTQYYVQVRSRGTDGTSRSTPSNVFYFTTTGGAVVNNPPVFSGTIANISALNGSAITAVNTSVRFTDTDALSYAFVGAPPAGIAINSSTGVITGTPTANGTFALQVRATDTIGQVAVSNSFNIVVSASNNAPVFSGTIPAISALQNSAITPVNVSTFFTDSDALTYSFVGAAPAGISINASTGVISGTPTALGTTSIQVRATDTIAQTATSNSFNIVVSATNNPPVFSGTIPNVSTAQGVAYLGSGAGAFFSDTDAITYSVVGTLPAGMSINASTGVISGTPTATGTATIQIRATDTIAQTTDSNSFTITVTPDLRPVFGSGVAIDGSNAEGAVVAAGGQITTLRSILSSGTKFGTSGSDDGNAQFIAAVNEYSWLFVPESSVDNGGIVFTDIPTGFGGGFYGASCPGDNDGTGRPGGLPINVETYWTFTDVAGTAWRAYRSDYNDGAYLAPGRGTGIA